MNIMGLIPARGGSKGIKNKNIINLAGRPLISYAIQALKMSEEVGRVFCTTDSEKIAEVARQYGAETPFLRPAELAKDASPVYPALVHAVKKIQELENYTPDFIVVVQPTSPLVKPEHVDGAVRLAISESADSVVTVVNLENDCHPYSIREVLPDGCTKFWMEREHYAFPDRQSRPKFFKFGNLYVSSYKTLMTEGRLEGKKNLAYPIAKFYDIDVNHEEDLLMVETLLKILK